MRFIRIQIALFRLKKHLFNLYAPICTRISGWFYDRWTNRKIMTSDYNMKLSGWFCRRAFGYRKSRNQLQ